MPSESGLEQIHNELLTLLKKFHEVCTSEGIQYTLHGGTLLGAIREKGFIPWDNDVDVAMTRAEYDKFCSVMAAGISQDEIAFDDCHRVPRLFMKNSGTFLDVFIYDAISENVLSQKIKTTWNMFLRAFIEDKANIGAAKKRKRYRSWIYWGYDFFQKIGGILPQGYALKKFNQFNQKCLCGSGNLIFRSNDGYPGMRIYIPAETMSRYQMTKFEDAELMVSTDYHIILCSSYGEDYMTPKKYGDDDIEAHEKIQQHLKNQMENRDH